MAFTAALCSAKRSCGWVPWLPHTSSWLSLPPEASSLSSGDHSSPHTCVQQG